MFVEQLMLNGFECRLRFAPWFFVWMLATPEPVPVAKGLPF
jgi:hypothetical protein